MQTVQESRGIELTKLAIEFGKKKLAEADGEVLGIRVGVKGGGCNGFSYIFEFAKAAREGRDQVLDFDGLKIIIDPKSLELLSGATLDWETKLVGYGFKWRNPNARDVCGCGDSFDVVR